ncbi:MAG: uroporphyrinogen-III C-methyltransferase [Candidatus Omnitrophica bacterium]|nr:uroporphyrinogen-III C-methyltransferase [Candidatus Omnitrophota bacterium]
MKKKYPVYLVGAGPGDPGLLTLRGVELLRQADVVVFDHLVSRSVLRHCSPKAKRIYAGKEGNGATSATQNEINHILIQTAKAGKRVVRLKGGDPFLFGRGGEEALALTKAGLEYEVVPGVSSAIAASAYAGIPVTHRGISSSLAVVTGHEDPLKSKSSLDWQLLSNACDTLVFLMGLTTLPGIVARLLEHGRSALTACAVIEWGTTAHQRTVVGNLKTIAKKVTQAAIHPPAVLVVGDVVKLRRELAWFEKKPLFGKRILVTRAADKAEALVRKLQLLGAEVEELAAIELKAVSVSRRFKAIIQSTQKPDWVFFTSPEGIFWFYRMLEPLHRDLRWLSGCHIAAIGPKTAQAIEAMGIHVDFIPKRYSQEGMIQDFPARNASGSSALILSAKESRSVLEVGLRKRGIRVSRLAIYRNHLPENLLSGLKDMTEKPFNGVTVTSASCAEHLHQALTRLKKGRLFPKIPFVSIGPVTSAAVRELGGKVTAEAKVSTIEGLIDAIQEGGSIP